MNFILKKETFKNLSHVGVGKAGSIILGLATVSLSARGLGVEKFGQLALFLSFVELANLLSLPGFNTILQKSIHHKCYKFYSKVYKYTFLSSVILGALALPILNLFQIKSDSKELAYYAIVFTIIRTLEKSEAILPALKLFKELSLFSFLSSLVRFLSIGLVIFSTNDLLISIKVYILFQALLGIVSFTFCRKKLMNLNSEMCSINFTNESFKMSLLTFFNTGISQIDRLILYQLSPTTLGVYQAGISYPEKLREVIKTFIMTINNSWLSFGNKEFYTRTKNNIYMLISVAILGSILMYISARFYVPILFGKEFIKSIVVAEAFGIIAFLRMINYFFSSRDIVFEKLSRHQLKIVIYRLSYLIALLTLVYKLGIQGVIIAAFLSEIIFFCFLILDFLKIGKE